jgi:hypothetical protein
MNSKSKGNNRGMHRASLLRKEQAIISHVARASIKRREAQKLICIKNKLVKEWYSLQFTPPMVPSFIPHVEGEAVRHSQWHALHSPKLDRSIMHVRLTHNSHKLSESMANRNHEAQKMHQSCGDPLLHLFN